MSFMIPELSFVLQWTKHPPAEFDPSGLEYSSVDGRSSYPVSQRGLDRGAGMQSPQHDHRGDGGACELGRDIGSNAGKAQHLDMQHLASRTRRVEVFAHRGLLDHVGVALELVADGGPDEIGPVRVETILDHQIDVPEIDIAEIDGDLLAVGGLRSELMNVIGHGVCHPYTI